MLAPGSKIYTTKNDSSIYAFRIGKQPMADAGFRMICAHCDSPTFRIKPNAEIIVYRKALFRNVYKSINGTCSKGRSSTIRSHV